MAESMSVEAVLKAVDANFTATMEEAVKSLGNVVKANSNMNNQVSSSNSQTEASSHRLTGGFKDIASALGLVAVASKAFDVLKDSIGGAVERFDTLNKFPVVMQALGYSTRDTAKATSTLKKGVDGLPTTLQDVTSVAQQLAPLTGSASKASRSAIALNNAFLASGASAADSSRGLEQYTQMLSTGKVDMMSWRTLMETMPIALRKVANSFGFTGKSAEQDLYKALQSGEITMDQLNDRFIELNNGQNGFASLAKKNSAGIMTSFTNLKNSVKNNLADLLTDINNGFSKAGLGSIAQVLDNMKGTINATFKAIGPVVTVATTIILNFVKVVGGVLKSAFGNNIFRGFITGILGFVGAFKGISGIISIVARLRSAFVALSVIAKAGNLASGFSEAMTTLAKSSKIAAAAQAVFNAVMDANPIVLVVSAIAALVAILVYFFTQTKTGRAAWASFTAWLSGVWQGLVGIATTVWNAIGNAITSVVNFIEPIWQGIVDFFSGIWQSIVAVAGLIWMGIVDVVKIVVNLIVTIWQGLIALISPIIAVAVAVIGTAFIAIVGIFKTVWNMLVPIVQVVWQVIVAVITTAISMVTTVISTGISVIVTIWTTIWNVLVTVVSSVWSIIGTVVTAGLQVIADIVNAITDVLKGNWSGAWNAIKDIVSTVLGAIISIISTGLSGLASIFNTVMNGLKSVVSSVWNGIKGLFNAGVNFIKSVIKIDLSAQGRAIMQSFFNGLKSIWENIKSFVSGIAGWIKEHKGPISYDRKLLIPAGQAIMSGLNEGLTNGFQAVQSTVSSMADTISNVVSIPPIQSTTFSRSLNAIQSKMQNMSASVDGTLTTNNAGMISVGSRLWQSQMTNLVSSAVDKLDNVDQHPVVTLDTANKLNAYNNKVNANLFAMRKG